MPLTLHPHLKRGLDHDDFYIGPTDAIEDVPREHDNTGEQVAKRQRVERIAAQYLKGRLPVISTASLRGPFNDGWKNPWAEHKKSRRRSSDKEISIGNGKAGVRKGKPVEAKRRTRSAGRKTLEEQAVASPETSRAVQSHVQEFEEPIPRKYSRSRQPRPLHQGNMIHLGQPNSSALLLSAASKVVLL
jgi:hypothetical protein